MAAQFVLPFTFFLVVDSFRILRSQENMPIQAIFSILSFSFKKLTKVTLSSCSSIQATNSKDACVPVCKFKEVQLKKCSSIKGPP